ncbi:TetR family transcriptional regulator [Microbacterium sp. cx-55]|uniref:TetR family transcriptional regulator n=1 Tax=Microbacterium sp. cx-55 TaxID=2875948 RepID=UPI001CBB9BB6|nr:TetR family transcriptional regulator [Microbacterium sp. cx-55]MBZ4486890.1 TetR family transcriptional regulator [Microbacterium sp. cx-55]UGB35814.1 TetR family transcriptional regulator [Microbacterium sp. cx-55]
MLDAATVLLEEGGISVGLHHLNMEELIRRVGVPRSSAFAAFGGKDELLTALMLRLLEPDGPHALGYSPGSNDVAAATFTRHADRLVRADGTLDPEGAAEVMRESIRLSLARNVADTMQSTQWRTYMALSVSVESLPPVQRPRVQAALRAAETAFLQQMGELYRSVLEYLGRRPAEGVTYLHIAAVGASLVEGMASKRLIGVTDADSTVTRPGLDGEPVEWEVTALAFAAMLDGLTRPV